MTEATTIAIPRPTERDVRIVDADGTATMLRLRPEPALPQSEV